MHIGGLHKDDRMASLRFLKSTVRRYGNSKKFCTDGISRLFKYLGFGNRTKSTFVTNKYVEKSTDGKHFYC